MSDHPPTRPKPGSLRDRIAAFENQAASHPAPPPPRPKPGGLQQWKPKQPPPPLNDTAASSADTTPLTSATTSTPVTSTGTSGGNSMSASDARESIKQGASLKDRMAALQGKVAFAGAEPSVAPAPAPKPKWKAVSPPVNPIPERKEEAKAEDASREHDSSMSSPPPAEQVDPTPENVDSAPAEEVDPEDEERRRRAGIAARMAKLGGARVGMMGAPLGMFAAKKSPPPPPPLRRLSKTETVPEPTPPAEEKEEEKCTETETSPPLPPPALSHSKSPPPSMPVPAVPRRTGPPRRKPPKSPVPSVPPTPAPDVQAIPDVGVADVAAAETQEVLKDVESLSKEEVEASPIEQVETMENLTVDHEEHAPQDVEEESKETADTHPEVEEERQIVEEPVEVTEHEEQEAKNEEEEEEEEEARRKRIADRLAKMGGVNPLFTGPPIPRRSSLREAAAPSSPLQELPPLRRSSADSVGSASVRKSSVDSVKEVELGAVKGVESGIPEQDEHVEEGGEEEGHEEILDNGQEEEEEETNDVMLPETPARHGVEVEHKKVGDIDAAPPPPLRPVRRFSGFVTRSDDEQHEHEEEEEAGPPSPPPLPVSPRFASFIPRTVANISSQLVPEEHDVLHEEPVPVPYRSQSSRLSVISTGSKYSQDEEEKREVEEEEVEEANKEEEKGEDDKDVKHVPPPPTRRVPLPPPPPLDDEIQEQHTHADEPLVIPPPSVEKRHSKDDSDTFEDVPLPHPISVRQAPVMDDEEGDPIDPSFHTPKPLSALLPPTLSPRAVAPEAQEEQDREHDSSLSDLAAAKKETIAERMAKLGGIRFGAAPMSGLPVRPPPPAPAAEGEEEVKETEETKEEEEENKDVDEEEEERARKERIAAKLAGMGGMRIGMMPAMGIPPRQVPSRPPPARPPPVYQTSTSSHDHDGEWEHDSATTPSEDGVKVEMEDSEMEEVHHEDAKLDEESEHDQLSSPVPPPPPRVQRQSSLSSSSTTPQPFQGVRPPIPSTANLVKRASLSGSTMASSASVRRQSSSGSTGTTTITYRPTVTKGQSDYVMVEEPQVDSPIEEQSPSLPPAPTRPPGVPTTHAMSDSIISQWELPSIPSGSLGLGLPTGLELSSSWTDAMDEGAPAPGTGHRYPPTHAPPAPPSSLASSIYGPGSVPPPVDLTADDLMAIWGRVGVQVCETATTMYEKAKKALVGDGTYAGFVRGVLNEVPNALKPAADGAGSVRWGYVVYAQNGSVVQRRISDILPGDVVEMVDARFKGHKGLQTYTQQVGASTKEIFVGIVSEYEPKKSKLKVLQANQHVGQQTVESVSYRLEDLKTGAIKVYRVLEAH